MPDDVASVLSRWGGLGERGTEVDPVAMRRMVEAMERDAAPARLKFDDLIARSSCLQYPDVGDPLSRDREIGEHRWLDGGREEVYSDWLAWILDRQRDPSRLLPLFGLAPPRVLEGTWTVSRELKTIYGRPDLILRHPRLGVLCVEVKTASDPRENQLTDYLQYLDRNGPSLGLVLLATHKPDVHFPEECKFQSWKEVAKTLRSWSSRWLSDKRVYDAVMTLSFCGAVERNLLGFGSEGLNVVPTVDYLEEVLTIAQSASIVPFGVRDRAKS